MTIHGEAGLGRTTEYNIWTNFMNRCNCPSNRDYHNYGGRGIMVCERWLRFENFLEDMGRRPEGMTLDRKDNDKGYSKDNCRWASRSVQLHNQRRSVITLEIFERALELEVLYPEKSKRKLSTLLANEYGIKDSTARFCYLYREKYEKSLRELDR